MIKKLNLKHYTISVLQGNNMFLLWISISRKTPKSLEQRRLTVGDLKNLQKKPSHNKNESRFVFSITLKTEICAKTHQGILAPVPEELLPDCLQSKS